jgi:hypothetical protein
MRLDAPVDLFVAARFQATSKYGDAAPGGQVNPWSSLTRQKNAKRAKAVADQLSERRAELTLQWRPS